MCTFTDEGTKRTVNCPSLFRERIVGLLELGGDLFVHSQFPSHPFKLDSTVFAMKSVEHSHVHRSLVGFFFLQQ